MTRAQVTPHLDIDLAEEVWVCRHCDAVLADAEQSYKRGCLVSERDPSAVHRPTIESEYDFAPDADWCRIVEFYCPDCGAMIENEYLPPGHPITHDLNIDIESLQNREGERATTEENSN